MIRPAGTADVPAVARIHAWYVEHTAITFALAAPTEAEWRAQWRQTRYPRFVCERGGAVVGYAYADQFNSRRGYDPTVMTSIYLDREHTGQGLGRPLYEALLAACAEQFHRAVAGITLPNEASIALHERLGFRHVGVFHEVGLKLGKRHDVCWMEAALA